MDNLAYISQPSPVDSSLFAPIRVACIRAFNSEKFCGKEGAVFFGDGVNGYVLTYMFLVSDPQSRGQHVKYAIMTMMTDRVYLVASMEYLISQFKRVAANLQAMASAVAHTSRAPQSPAIRSTSFSSSHRGSIVPDSSMGPTRRGRPLPDVVGKPDIFIRLHSAFVSILSSCSQRLFERHIVGRPEPQDNQFDIERSGTRMLDSPVELTEEELPPPVVTIDSLRELRRVLGRQKFDRFIWNALIGNQVIVRGSETRIVSEIVLSLEDVLPKGCCTVIMNPSTYEPSYACNILGLHRSVGIPPDMDPSDFVLLDVCTSAFGHQVPTPPTSMPALSQSNGANGGGLNEGAGGGAKADNIPSKPVYQAEWSDSEYFAPDVQGLQLDVAQIALSKDGRQPIPPPLLSSPTAVADAAATATVRGPPKSMPTGVSYTSDAGFQAQRRIYHLQAGEESPQPAGLGGWPPGAVSSAQSLSTASARNLLMSTEAKSSGGSGGGGGGGRSGAMTKTQRPILLVERVNEILDLKLPRQIEKRRFSILREEWISIAKQFHNLYKARLTSDEATVDRFLQSMMVDRRDLKT
ncbi:hypothetical protein DFQ26_001079 [Actinomortierella ambigua]|nr:hypothetical protein DFQ26_001079 [Actinomortierella ambigua]